MRELVRAVLEKDRRALEAYAALGIEPKAVARNLLTSVFEQAFVHRLLHADPHAGNLVVLVGGVVGYLDFGIVAPMDEQLWRKQRNLFRAVATQSVHGAYEAILDTLVPLPAEDLTAFESEVKDLVWSWIVATRTNSGDLAERSTGRLILEVANVARRFGIRLPWRFLVLHRSTLLSDTIILTLDPDFDSIAVLQRLFRRQERRITGSPLDAFFTAWDVGTRLPAAAEGALDWVETNLPGLSRSYARQIGGLEKAVVLFLHDTRLILYMVAGSIGVGRLAADDWVPPLTDARVFFLDWWWAMLATALLGAVLAARSVSALQEK
jgi:predicted unusual protein kinase regulating ubiquinone biosynthesis (AarF/ABC1/UbiB family)